MINEFLETVLKSGAGAELLQQVQAKGLPADQAAAALKATAQAVIEQGGAGGLASLATGMLGGGGGLASLAGGLFGGGNGSASGAEASSLTAMVPGIAQFVAQKTGLDPAMASTVVTMVLPKIAELVKSHAG